MDKIVQATERPQRALAGKDKIALRVGKVLQRYKMGKHFQLEITEECFNYRRKQEAIEREAALDGIYVVRSSLTPQQMTASDLVRSYKRLSVVEQAFRSFKTVDLKVRPIYHRLEDRVRAHLFLCMLAYYVQWHMRQKLAPVLFQDEDKAAAEACRSVAGLPQLPGTVAVGQDLRRGSPGGRLPAGPGLLHLLLPGNPWSSRPVDPTALATRHNSNAPSKAGPSTVFRRCWLI